MRQLVRLLGILALLLLPGVARGEYPDTVLDAAARVPIQDAGRIKPLASYARFSLMQLSGRATLAVEGGEKHSPVAWLLECMLDPSTAAKRAVFLIESPELMELMRLPHEGPRVRFSYETLRPVRSQVVAMAGQYAAMPESSRSPAQKQLLRLAANLRLYESISATLDGLGHAARPEGTPPLSELLANYSAGAPAAGGQALLQRILARDDAAPLSLLPPNPLEHGGEIWTNPAGLARGVVSGRPAAAAQLEALRALELLADAGQETEQLTLALGKLREASQEEWQKHREYRQLEREVFFYKVAPFQWSQILYTLVFVMSMVMVALPRLRWLDSLCLLALCAPLAIHVWGIGLRCVIRGRPPVSTLYETILFVSAVAVAVAVVVELLQRRRVAMAAGAVLGMTGLFLAGRYEALERVDTMPHLTAVLDTNFWLSTHVTCVTMGYAAGLLAGALAHVYLVGKAFGLPGQDFYKALTRMVYGVFCFALLFSSVGTVLGGIWANESWGRFWGWDPKENGALMIVLWGLAVLHARLGGYLRDYGLNLAALFGGVIVTYSWFGVNLLGIGLHSYGFTGGIQTALTRFYLFESGMLLIGCWGWLREQGVIRIRF